MKTLTTLLLFGLVCLFFIGCVQGDKKVTLRLKYQPGMKLVYDQTTKSGTRVTAGDSLIEESSHTYNVDISFDIISLAEDGTAEILDSSTWSYEVVSKEDSSQMKTVERSRVSTMFVQPNGRYTDLILSSEEKLSTVTWLKSYFEQGMPVFPDGELTPGYSWTQSTKVLLPEEPFLRHLPLPTRLNWLRISFRAPVLEFREDSPRSTARCFSQLTTASTEGSCGYPTAHQPAPCW